MYCSFSFSQSIDFSRVGKDKLIRYNGGLSATSIFYEGTGNRQQLTYFLNGNLNFNIAGLYSIPLSFTYSNQNFDFPSPFRFNRLSLNPSYKWINAHIGDVALSFSPYTLNGHQFTGVGIDLTPAGSFKISALYGRFLRATEFNDLEPNALVAYERRGYGLKTSYDFKSFKLGLILFKATDDETSLNTPIPVDLGITPQENAVGSLEGEFAIFDKAKVRIEYALSGVTQDVRLLDGRQTSGLLSFLLNENVSTNYFNALNASLDYSIKGGSLGIGYERIDPRYQTFGAYFFNNDLENITLNANKALFQNKVNLSVNAGLQQDNLDDTKTSELQRIVSAVNLNYRPSEKIGIAASYSNFQSFTNIQDQFDFVNQVGQFDNVDTLNYRQISQNANLGFNYFLERSEKRQKTLNLNLVYQTSDNQQEGESIENGKNSFYNGTASYTLGYPKQSLNVSVVANVSYNTVGELDRNLIVGPTLAANKLFFDKKLRTNFSASYNSSFSNGEQTNSIYSFRVGGNYALHQKHSLNLSLLTLLRSTMASNNTDFTATLGYNYTFDNFKIPLGSNPRDRQPRINELRFRHRNTTYSGTFLEVDQQLETVYNSLLSTDFPQDKKQNLDVWLKKVKQQRKNAEYKENALFFLEELYAITDFITDYNRTLYSVIYNLKNDFPVTGENLESLYLEKKVAYEALTEAELKKAKGKIAKKQFLEIRKKLAIHQWIEKQFEPYTLAIVSKPTGHLKNFKASIQAKVFEQFYTKNDLVRLEKFLENRMIVFYYKKAEKLVGTDDFDLKSKY